MNLVNKVYKAILDNSLGKIDLFWRLGEKIKGSASTVPQSMLMHLAANYI